MQHLLKSASGAADARIVAAELLDELFVAVHDAVAALHAGLGGIPLRRLLERVKAGLIVVDIVSHDASSLLITTLMVRAGRARVKPGRRRPGGHDGHNGHT
jgi:hypothetical protein